MELIETGCVKRQICVLKNGSRTGIYYDVKNMISYPNKLTEVGDKIFSILNKDYPDCKGITLKIDTGIYTLRRGKLMDKKETGLFISWLKK